MKSLNTQTGNRKKILLISAGTVVALVILSSVYVYALGGNLFGWTRSGNSSSQIDAATDEQKKAGSMAKESSATDLTDKGSAAGDDQPSSPVPQPNGKSKVDLTITAANQNGSTLQIRSIIGVLSNSGTCTLTLSKGGQTVTKTASVQAQASESTCQGFDIAVSELSSGSWKATLHFENDKYQADTERTVNVQ